MNKLFDFKHPVFRPLWVRILVTAACFGWAVVEFIIGTPFWGMLFGAAGVMAVYGLFIKFDPDQ